MHRYHRQMLLEDVGEQGQQALSSSRVLIAGVGALGCSTADALCRAGVGSIRLVDRDIVERTNLQRQVLYAQPDEGRPKAIAAADRLRAINSDIEIDAHVADIGPDTIEQLAQGCDLLIDGLDNLDTRYLINDLAVREGLPWVYAGAVGTGGMVMPLLPNHCAGRLQWSSPTGCLRCIFPEPPPAGTLETCDTAGVLGPAIGAVTSHQAALALHMLMGQTDERLDRTMHAIDPWLGESRRVPLPGPLPHCPCCSERRFEWLEEGRGSTTTVLCGRSAVQIHPTTKGTLDLALLAGALSSHGSVHHDAHVLRIRLPEDVQLTVFADGRALLGTNDPTQARALYDRYIGR